MSKGGGSTPDFPDPIETLKAESALNRVDTFSPSGAGIQHGYVGANGRFQAGIAPDGARNAIQSVEGQNAQALRGVMEPASLRTAQNIITNNVNNMPRPARVQGRGTVAQDIFDRNFSLMAPGIDRANSRLLNNLQARGLPIGGEAFNDAYGEQTRNTQETISRLAQDANITAGNEQSRLFGLDQAQRAGSISEIAQLMGGAFSPNSAQPTGNVAPSNLSGLLGQQYGAQSAAAQQQASNKNAALGAIGTLGSALLLSSRETKEIYGNADVDGAAHQIMSLPVSIWKYTDEKRPAGDHEGFHIGPMAEDFQEVTGLGNGSHINVTDYLGLLMAGLQSALSRVEELEAVLGVTYEQPEARVN